MACVDVLFNLFDNNGRTVVAGAKNFLSLEYQRSENEIGAFEIVLPPFYRDFGIGPDWVFEFYRNMSDGMQILDGNTCWFARRFEEIYERDQCGLLTIGGHDTVGLLKRRIVAWYAPGDAPPGFNGEGFKTQPADDAIREIFQENFGSKVDGPGAPPSVTSPVGYPEPTNYTAISRRMAANRRISEEETGSGSAPIVALEIAWQDALQAMQSIAQSASQQDPKKKVLFDIVYTPSNFGRLGQFDFRVWTGARGSTRSGILFSPEYGNLLNARFTQDYTDESNWVHVGGPGSGTDRIVAGVVDQRRSRSPFYPIESFVEKNDLEVVAEESIIGAGQAELNARGEKVTLAAEVVQLDNFEFGVNYEYGDLIQAAVRGVTFESTVSNFRVTAQDGAVDVEVSFNAERFL